MVFVQDLIRDLIAYLDNVVFFYELRKLFENSLL